MRSLGRHLLLGVVALAGCSENAAPTTLAADAGSDASMEAGPPEAVLPGLFPLLGADPNLVAPDMGRLDPLVQNAQVVGLGESVHTTGGQYHLRLRMLRHLIEHQNFRAIAFESNWRGIADVMEPYVQTCAGNPEDAAKRLHPIWWDVSVPPFLKWLCEWNQAHAADKVHVFGFDIRQPWYDAPAFRGYITARQPATGPALADGVSSCLGVGYADEAAFFADPAVREYFDSKLPTPEKPHTDCQSGVAAAAANLQTNRAEYVAATSEEAYELVRLAVAQLGAFDETIYGISRLRVLSDLRAPNHARDVVMYDAFKTLRKFRFPGLKTALWAHNGHLMKRANTLVDSQWTGVQSLGTSLGEEYGAAYVTIGQTSWETSVHLFPREPAVMPKPGKSSLEARLEAHKLDLLLLVLPAGTEGASPAIPAGNIALGTDPYVLTVANHFDAIAWHRSSPAASFFALPGP